MVAVALALFCVADVDASGVVRVPPDVVVWPVLAVPLADGVPVLVVLPGVWVCCCVETEPCAGGSNRDGGKTSVLERLGVAGPLAFGVRAGAPLPTLPLDDVVPDDPLPGRSGRALLRPSSPARMLLGPRVSSWAAPLWSNVAMRPSFRRRGTGSHPKRARANAIDDSPCVC